MGSTLPKPPDIQLLREDQDPSMLRGERPSIAMPLLFFAVLVVTIFSAMLLSFIWGRQSMRNELKARTNHGQNEHAASQ